MRKAVALALLFAACASNSKAPVTRPEVRIAQISGVPVAARHVTGPIPVQYAVRVTNRASEPITLKRIDVSSMADGAYTVRASSTPFNVTIAPEKHGEVDFWANAIVEQATISGANGPVTLRLVLFFDTPVGPFEEIVVRQVNESAGAASGPR